MRPTTSIIALLLGAALIAGCTDLDGNANRTATGGLVGAGTGALIGRAIAGAPPAPSSAAPSAASPARRSAPGSTGSNASSNRD
jgi:hypothetical protein